MKTTSSLIAITALVAAGCASAPSPTENRFGHSTRLMVERQSAQSEPAPIVATALDGELGAAVLETHRQDVAKPEKVETNIVFNIGE